MSLSAWLSEIAATRPMELLAAAGTSSITALAARIAELHVASASRKFMIAHDAVFRVLLMLHKYAPTHKHTVARSWRDFFLQQLNISVFFEALNPTSDCPFQC